jgi:hypothetical protein
MCRVPKNAVFWGVAPCTCSGWPPAHAGSSIADFSTLKMEAIWSFETSVQSTTSTWRHTPEDGILHSHRRENLKSYICAGSRLCGSYVNGHFIPARTKQIKSTLSVAGIHSVGMSHDRWVVNWRGFGRIRLWSNQITASEFSYRNRTNSRKTSVKIDSIPIWIGTHYPWNKSQGATATARLSPAWQRFLRRYTQVRKWASPVLLTQDVRWEFELLRLPLCTCFYQISILCACSCYDTQKFRMEVFILSKKWRNFAVFVGFVVPWSDYEYY